MIQIRAICAQKKRRLTGQRLRQRVQCGLLNHNFLGKYRLTGEVKYFDHIDSLGIGGIKLEGLGLAFAIDHHAALENTASEYIS